MNSERVVREEGGGRTIVCWLDNIDNQDISLITLLLQSLHSILYWSDGFSSGIRCAKLCGGSHLRPLEDSARGSDSTQLPRGKPSAKLQVRQVSEDLLLWGLPDRDEVLLVRPHRPHLLSLLLLRRDAGLQVRSAGANLPPAHRRLHTENSDLPGQLHWRQDKGEHPSIRVI